ncbi:Set1 complex component spp1 [Pseudocercospora fuligena]|uniref:Set1 complex component spp1 n=1 Tax=Pseudocercospora fuligena TaxID=685502 RepID=A0A8H6RAF5_9PEZI|nr:Set1 complex component spp1 [Pseudocercospora fuligena]
MASLASLLNPSPDSDTRPSSPPRKDSLPPIQNLPSPEDRADRSPGSTRSNPQQFTYPQATAQEAAQALAKLSASPAAPPAQWNGYSAADGNQLERQQSWERRASGYGDPMQLPPPGVSATRKMSSPTLDQYHVASRSPEQRRPSAASPQQSNIQLPPLQGFAAPSSDHSRRLSHTSHHELSHASSSHSASLGQSEQHGLGVNVARQESSHVTEATSLPQLKPTVSNISALPDDTASSPAPIKQEGGPTPQPSSPTDARRPSEMDLQTSRAVASLKSENTRNQSPLRESSVPVPTTEIPAKEESVPSKKRPAPAKTKKGTASAVKKDKAPPAKKRKVETKRSETPSSLTAKSAVKKGNSTKGTPLNSSPAPSARSNSADMGDEEEEEIDEDEAAGSDTDLYCICRKPDNGTFMIGCDGTCDDWFHGKCVGIEERDKNLIDKYMCPSCTTAGIGRTTWKRICRRSGCRQPARTGKTKAGTSGSKYCSEECGVLYFREMVARTRGTEEKVKERAARRKGSLDTLPQLKQEDDIGARGGALAAGEVKALIDSAKNAEEFKKLGNGVLSPPTTPDGKDGKKADNFTEAESEALQRITARKDVARSRHALLKDRLTFVTMVKQAATRTAAEKELKPKDYCGYDPRLEWTEERFEQFRNSKIGQQAFELQTLATEKNGVKDDGIDEDEEMPAVCDKKKCARHHEWSKLAVDDLRFEMADNGDKMRGLDKEEKEMRERAALRAKAGTFNGEGTVEVHGLGISTEPAVEGSSMDVDGAAPATNGHGDVPEQPEPMAIDTA